jgi:hypothetical protein
MEATTTTIPAPAQRGRFTKIAAVAIAVTALALAVAGTVALAANAWRDSNGYFNWPTKTFSSGGYAIAMKTVDISHAPQWVFSKAGLDSVRVKAHSDRPIFIGIARITDLERYLHGTEHDDVSGLTYSPFQVNYEHTNGHAPRRAPADESFWAKSTRGSGNVALAWHPRPGSWARRPHERGRITRRHRPTAPRRPHLAALVARRLPACGCRTGRRARGLALPQDPRISRPLLSRGKPPPRLPPRLAL